MVRKGRITEPRKRPEVPDKPLVWLKGEIKTPPFSEKARVEAGMLLRRLQKGEVLQFPQSRSIKTIGKRCHELRIRDENKIWRIIYRVDPRAIVIGEVFEKESRKTPQKIIDDCKRRYRQYDEAIK